MTIEIKAKMNNILPLRNFNFHLKVFLFAACTALQTRTSYTQTFYKDIAPIIHAKCTPCHRPGESAPFSLISYDDVAKRTSFIKKVIQEGYMPPWKANNEYVHFANVRSLEPSEKQLIISWIDGKKERGKAKKSKVQTPYEVSGLTRTPDLTLMAQDTFVLQGDNNERFVVFKIPFELDAPANIEAVEFVSNDKRVIHHANYAVHEVADPTIDIRAAPRLINLSDEARSLYDAYLPLKKVMTYYGGWIPGASAETYPSGIGWVLPKRGIILLTVHFGPSAIERKSISGINLFFTNQPIERTVKVVSFGSGGIGENEIRPSFFMIPANKISSYSLKVSNPSEDFSALYVWPHMHYIGKEFKAYVVTPQNDTIPLVHIPEWDFRWQELYRFKNLVKIPKGSVIHLECSYDNTADNPFNPFSPPENIFSYSDMKTTQEMMTMLLVFLPYKEGDEFVSTSQKSLRE
ncbi:monooxygenase [Parapedobacter composti]|nr:cytochrome c [Parapedobacter composti]